MKKWSVILSTTEPENYVGIIKVRQGNKNTEVLQAIITENGLPLDLSGYEVSFQAMIGGKYTVERPAKIINATSGLVEYTFDDYTMQLLGKQTANFSIKNGNNIIGTSQDFMYFVINAVSKTPGEMGSYWQSAEALIDDMTDYFNTEKSYAQALLESMKKYLDEGKLDFQSWVDSVKEIIESIDPGGKLLAELVDLQQTAQKYIPSGFAFTIEHDSEYQPEVKVTSYKNALGTEVNGLDTGPVFGGETIYNVPVALSYDRQKVYVEMPKSYTLSGDIIIIDDGILLIIKEAQILCFEISGAKITKGYVFVA